MYSLVKQNVTMSGGARSVVEGVNIAVISYKHTVGASLRYGSEFVKYDLLCTACRPIMENSTVKFTQNGKSYRVNKFRQGMSGLFDIYLEQLEI